MTSAASSGECVVVTLRAIGAILPSAWQQGLKAGVTTGYNQWLKVMFDGNRPPAPSVLVPARPGRAGPPLGAGRRCRSDVRRGDPRW